MYTCKTKWNYSQTNFSAFAYFNKGSNKNCNHTFQKCLVSEWFLKSLNCQTCVSSTHFVMCCKACHWNYILQITVLCMTSNYFMAEGIIHISFYFPLTQPNVYCMHERLIWNWFCQRQTNVCIFISGLLIFGK